MILDCDYDMGNSSTDGLVVKWTNNDILEYKWHAGRLPEAVETATHIEVGYKASNDPYKMYRAMKFKNPNITLTGDYKCDVFNFVEEQIASASMIVYCKYYSLIITLYHARLAIALGFFFFILTHAFFCYWLNSSYNKTFCIRVQKLMEFFDLLTVQRPRKNSNSCTAKDLSMVTMASKCPALPKDFILSLKSTFRSSKFFHSSNF